MPEPIREQILAAVETALGGLAGVTVKRDTALPNTVPAGGLMIVRDNGDQALDGFVGVEAARLAIGLEVMVASDDATASLRVLRADARKALVADPTLGGLALDLALTARGEVNPLAVEGTAPFAAAVDSYAADYWTAEGDPYALAP